MVQLLTKASSFFIKCKRVWLVLRKPTRKEYEQIAKVSAIGIALLGIIGFLVSLIMTTFK